jgi:hypothetical protein
LVWQSFSFSLWEKARDEGNLKEQPSPFPSPKGRGKRKEQKQLKEINTVALFLVSRFRPAHAALFESETGEQGRHADGRSDGFNDRNAELIL